MRCTTWSRAGRARLLVSAVSTLLVLGVVLGGAGRPAAADTRPVKQTPATVSADPLPTVQIDGVVWSQVTVGDTVYATGRFSSARPAGAALGTSETPRGNLLAYNITTGKLITRFDHALNGQGRSLTASPDGTRVYVGGDFTAVDGATRNRVAAFDTATGALVPGFAPNVSGTVRTLAATNTTLYAGGDFNMVNGLTRVRLAAVSAAGALLGWAPAADHPVWAMALSPSGARLNVGGMFKNLGGVPAYGLGALDTATGAPLSFPAGATVRDAGDDSAITSLHTAGGKLFGTGFVFGVGGNLEGTFAADPETGALQWVEDCHGDSYDTAVVAGVLYKVSHSHDCGNIGGFPETDPSYRATAFTTYPTGTVGHEPPGDPYADFGGNAAPTLLHWYPSLDIGTASGQHQAAWSATGNDKYLALGGEFPRVNRVAQQGLVRFAVSGRAPNKTAPQFSAAVQPRVASLAPGTARVGWTTTWDMDNEALTYKVVRDDQVATPVYTVKARSSPWRLPVLGFVDRGLVPGSTHSYHVLAVDPFGNLATTATSTRVTITGGPPSAYARGVLADGATSYWRLGETSGTTGYDWAGFDDLRQSPAVAPASSSAIVGDPDGAAAFDGSRTVADSQSTPAPAAFSLEAWVRTNTSTGGRVVGFGSAATGTSSTFDRHVYLDDAGHLVFGTYQGGAQVASSSLTYNDDAWHHVVATQSGAGMVLYVDGLEVATNTTTAGAAYAGYWRIGGDSLAGWPSQPTSSAFTGSIDDVAVYPKALTGAQVQQHYRNSGRP